MPVYEFQCGYYGHVTELWAKVSQAGKVIACDTCGEPAHRIISAPAPPVMGGMVYRPDPHKPLASRAEVKVPMKEIQARDNQLRERMLKRAGKPITPAPDMVKP